MVYYILIALLSFFSFIEQFKPPKADISILKYIACTIIIFIGGLRYEVGADWFAYEKLFDGIESFSDLFLYREEKLFMIFQYVCKTIFDSYSFFVFVLFTLTFYLKFKIFNKYSTDVFFSLIIYVYTLFLIYDVNGIRQGMAMTLVLMSITAIKNKNKYLFILLILAACLSHTSALIFVPFYWLSKIQISHKKFLLITFFTLVISVVVQKVILNSSLFQYFLIMDSFSHYSYYLEDDAATKQISLISVPVFQRILVFGLFIMNYEKINLDIFLKQILMNGYFFGILIFLFLSFNSEYAARLSFYYKSFEIIMIPLIISAQTKYYSKIILWLVFIVFSVVGLNRLLAIPDGGLIPYKTILF